MDDLGPGYFQGFTFFSDSASVEFTLFPTNDFDKNIIKGGRMNKIKSDFDKEYIFKLKPFIDLRDSLQKDNRYYTEDYLNLKNQPRQSKEDMIKLRNEIRLFKESNQIFTLSFKK